MHLKILLSIFFIVTVVCGNPRKFTTEKPQSENFVLVGASQSSPSVKFEENKDDKALR